MTRQLACFAVELWINLVVACEAEDSPSFDFLLDLFSNNKRTLSIVDSTWLVGL